MNLSRVIRRLLLARRARRIAVERQFQELNEMLARIRDTEEDRPPWQRRVWADEVD